MLGKLIKHEFLDTYKLICVYYAVVAALTILCGISVNTSNSSTNNPSILLQIIFFLTQIAYMLLLSLLGLITILALCSHFNKTMYGDQGYLTHTLPVKKGSLLASKYIVAIVWCIASLLVIFLSIVIFGSMLTGVNQFKAFYELISGQWQEISDFVQSNFNCNLTTITLLSIIGVITAVMHLFSFIWACISIGQLANVKRNLVGIFSGIGLWFVEFFINRAIMKVFRLSFYGDLVDMIVSTTDYNPRFDLSLLIYIIMSLIFFAAETFVTWFISSKKLNLA